MKRNLKCFRDIIKYELLMIINIEMCMCNAQTFCTQFLTKYLYYINNNLLLTLIIYLWIFAYAKDTDPLMM